MENLYFALAFNIFLLMMVLGLQVVYRIKSYGLSYAVSKLDAQHSDKKCQLRARRAKDNQIEFLMLFVSLLFALTYLNSTLEYLKISADIIIFTRGAYIITVLVGIPYLRSLLWLVGSLPLFYFLSAVLS